MSFHLTMKRCGLAFAALAGVLAAGPGAIANAQDVPPRGALISSTPVAHLTRSQAIRAIHRWKEEDRRLDTSSVRHGIEAFRLVYATVEPDGTTPTTASGLVVLPSGVAGAPRVVAWEHGTTIAKRDAPSTGASADARLTAYLLGAGGFVAVAPDYLGLGTGPGRHPFNDRASEVTASVDMLRAARDFVGSRSLTFDPRILVAGFSQGGKVAMALGDALQSGADRDLRLAALAGISGPYDLQHAQVPKQPTLDPFGVTFSLTYTAVAANQRDHLYARPSQVWRAPFDASLPRLFDGTHPQAQVLAHLAPYRKVFTRAFLRRIAHPRGGILKAMRASDGACRWAPAVPTRLYAARTDEQVAYLNTVHCRDDLARAGATVPVIQLGRHSHFGSAILGTDRVVRWFHRIGLSDSFKTSHQGAVTM